MSDENSVANESPSVGPLPRNPVVVAVLSFYVLLALAVAALVLTLATDDEVAVIAEVIVTGVGEGSQIVAAWPDHNGEPWETTLTPRDPREVPEGSTVEIRFHPGEREYAYTTDPRFHEARDDVGTAVVFTAIALLLACLLLWAWTWRLGRWWLGRFRSPETVTARVLVATPPMGSHGWDPEPAALWLRLSLPDGGTRYQRALWNRRLIVEALRRTSEPPRVFGPDADQGRPTAVVRRCPGFRRMYVVDLPGVGRIWPASTARRRGPRLHGLDPVDPRRHGEEFRGGAAPAILAVVGVVAVGYVWWHAGVLTAASVPVIVSSAWLWTGATPIRGVYASRPDPDQPRRRVWPHRRADG